MRRAIIVAAMCAAALVASRAYAGAYEDCVASSSQAALVQCLASQEKDANAELASAEAAMAQKARSIEQATGKPGIRAALAKSVRDFAAYRASQCAYVRELAAREPIGEQAQIACRVDLTRRRVRELRP